MDNIEIIHDATTVNKAVLIHDLNAKIYSLVHHDTEILRFNEDHKILKAIQCSSTSTRSIYQVADYFKIDRIEIQKLLKPFRDFYKYPVGA